MHNRKLVLVRSPVGCGVYVWLTSMSGLVTFGVGLIAHFMNGNNHNLISFEMYSLT